MGSISASGEPDAGTLYPTILVDSSGHSTTVEYQNGRDSANPNTSARIVSVVSNGNVQASFIYSSLHLAQIENVSTSHNYTLTFNETTIAAPFGPSTRLQISSLASIQATGDPKPYAYDYNGFGELAQVTNPHNFSLAWTYTNFTFANGATNREIESRTIKAGDSADARVSRFIRPSSDSGLTVHSQLSVASPDSTETFQFQTSGDAQQLGLPLSRTISFANSKLSSTQNFVWSKGFDSEIPQLQNSASLEIDSTGVTRNSTRNYLDKTPNTATSNPSAQRVQCEVGVKGIITNCGGFGPDPCVIECNGDTGGDGSDDDTNVNFSDDGFQSIEVQGHFVPVPVDNAPLNQTLNFKPGIDFSGDFIYIDGVNTGVSVPNSQMNADDIGNNLLLGSTIIDLAGVFVKEGLELDAAAETALEQLTANKAAGNAGEKAVLDYLGVEKNTSIRIDSATKTASYRIPDFITQTVIGEIKNYTTTLRFTTQIEDSMIFAKQTGRTFELWTRSNTPLAVDLQTLISEGAIVHRIIPGM